MPRSCCQCGAQLASLTVALSHAQTQVGHNHAKTPVRKFDFRIDCSARLDIRFAEVDKPPPNRIGPQSVAAGGRHSKHGAALRYAWQRDRCLRGAADPRDRALWSCATWLWLRPPCGRFGPIHHRWFATHGRLQRQAGLGSQGLPGRLSLDGQRRRVGGCGQRGSAAQLGGTSGYGMSRLSL